MDVRQDIGYQGEDRRIFQRIPVSFPLRFVHKDRNQLGNALCWDICPRGVGFFTQEKLELRQNLDIWLDIPDEYEPLHVTGRVVWQKEVDLNTHRVGIQFSKAYLLALSRIFRTADRIDRGASQDYN